MISDDIQLATMDLEDFYLGTPLPHPEYIRIPVKFLPPKVIPRRCQALLHLGPRGCKRWGRADLILVVKTGE